MEHLRHWVLVMWLVRGKPNKHWESLWYLLGIVLQRGSIPMIHNAYYIEVMLALCVI